MRKVSALRLTVILALTLIVSSLWVFADQVRSSVYAHDDSRWVDGIPGRTAVLCVANLDGSKVSHEILQKIHTAYVSAVKTNPYYRAAGLDVSPSIPANEANTREEGIDLLIRNSCPDQATLKSNRWGNNRVSSPGPVHTYLFIASEADLESVPFKHYPRVVGQEDMCEEAQCNSVANALYITLKELNDPKALNTALLAGIGLSWDDMTQSIYVDGVTPDDRSK